MSEAQQLLKDGVAAAKAGNKVEARNLIRQVVALEPRNETAWLWLAGLAESPLESVHFLERVLRLNPQHEKARIAIRAARVQAGIAAARAQDRVQARLLLLRAVDSDPSNEAAWLWLASVAETAEEGAHYLERVLEINPDNERARTGLERYRAQVALRGPAAEQAESPVDEEPGSPEQGESWECPFCQAPASGAVERCSDCKAILTLEHPELFFRPAAAIDLEKINAALERLEQVVNTDFTAAWQMGLAYLNLKQPDAGLDWLRTASELLPHDDAFAEQVEALVQYRNGLTQQRTAPGQRKTILVVDDSPTIRKLVTLTVERRGYATRTASSGDEAIDVIRERGVPDLILLDINMPGMDGYQLCRLLREHADTTNIPIIMLSGKDGFFNKVRGRMAGSTEYITKPFEPEGLLLVVQRYCALENPTEIPGWPVRAVLS